MLRSVESVEVDHKESYQLIDWYQNGCLDILINAFFSSFNTRTSFYLLIKEEVSCVCDNLPFLSDFNYNWLHKHSCIVFKMFTSSGQ